MTPSDQKPKSKARTGNRVSSGLVALGSATVVAIYSAGFYKTKAAADRFAGPPMPGNPRGPIGIPGGPGGPGRGAPSMPGGGSDGPAAGRGEAGAPGDARSVPPAAPAVTLAIPTVPRAEAPVAPAKITTAAASAAPPAAAAVVNDVTASASQPAVVASGSSSAQVPASGSQQPAASATAPSPAPASAAPAVAVSSSVAASPAPAASIAPAPKFKDGTYTGWGTCRHGDIQARIEITGGRIVTSEIAQCLTRYSCSWISPLPPQVISRQSENVDYVSGATDSAIAFYWAVFDALSKAK